jgi:hypothetical protein
MELQIDFSAHLAKHLCPSYSTLVTLLTQTVQEWPKGSAMLTNSGKGVFNIKVWDKARGEKLIGKKIEYYYEGDKSTKHVEVKIEEKPKTLRFTNPKYVTLVGLDRFPANQMTNEQFDNILGQFGDIIIPTQDVYAEIFLTGKKKVRIDLNKGLDIPRDLFAQFTSEEGKNYNVTVRNYYKDQPWVCRGCKVKHVGDCPEWLKEKEEKEKAMKIKEENTRTAFIGDSNNRCINESGVMASVTAITGGKIGHIANQIGFENLEKIENVVISAGQNCINDRDDISQEAWESRTMTEIALLETAATNLLKQGKNLYLVSVPPAPCTQESNTKKEARRFINNRLSTLTDKLRGKHGSQRTVMLLDENEGNFNINTDFTDERHLSQLAIERRLSQLDEMLPNGKKIKNTQLSARATCAPYRGCYGAYPVGCNFCTKKKHNEGSCPTKNASTTPQQIRKTVSSSEISPDKKKSREGR